MKLKELKDAIYFPLDASPEEKEVMIKILEKRIDEEESKKENA